VNWARAITTLVIQLAARVGKSCASPICPFLYHLYERKELLKPEEEKSWKIQEGMLKYGESGSEDEGGSGSGSKDEEDDEEEEEEEETQVLLNRPPKRQRQEDKSAQIGATLIPKVEGPSLSSSKDRFQSIYNALGEMQAEHDRRRELLWEACKLAVCAPSELPDRIRNMMVKQARVEDLRKLREENARLNLEVGSLINKNWAAWKQAEAAAERIWQGCHIERLSGKSRPKDVVRARPDVPASGRTSELADRRRTAQADGPGGRPVLRQSAQPPYRKTARNIITFFNFFSPLQGSPSSTVAPRVTPQSYFLL
jgi:hypothetical protein